VRILRGLDDNVYDVDLDGQQHYYYDVHGINVHDGNAQLLIHVECEHLVDCNGNIDLNDDVLI